MKNLFKVLGVIALAAVIGFSFTACGGDDDGGAETYIGTADNVTYTLIITGDAYVLTGVKTSTGSVVSFSGGVFTLRPRAGSSFIYATVSGNNLTNLSGYTTWDDGTPFTAPGALTGSGGTPVNPGTGGNGSWISVTNNKFESVNGVYNVINAIVYANGKFVAGGFVGDSAKMAYSTNGINWTAVSDPKFNGTKKQEISGIAYGNGKFVAVGAWGTMAYSTDGINWTAVSNSTFGDTFINKIAYGSDKFVAVGSDGKMAYSTDGINWNAVATSSFNNTDAIYDIAYGNGKFVAVGRGSIGKIAYSSNGINWTAVSDSTFNGKNDSIYGIAYGNGKFVAGGEKGKIAYSTDDGITWTNKGEIFGGHFVSVITYGNNKFVAGGTQGDIAYSTDGINWTRAADSPFAVPDPGTWIYAITYGNDKFVAVGAYGRMAYLTDGSGGTGGSVAVTNVTLNQNTLSLTAGATATLTATITPSNATNKALTWSSSNPGVATVNNGTVTAVAAGSATITVTADGNKTAVCTVTVTGSGTNPGTGGGGTLTITGIPSQYNGKYVTFSSTSLSSTNLLIQGWQSINYNPSVYTLSRISNGSVSIPIWIIDSKTFLATGAFARYTGNDDFNIGVIVTDLEKQSSDDPDLTYANMVAMNNFASIKFSNGNATKTWSAGTVIVIPK